MNADPQSTDDTHATAADDGWSVTDGLHDEVLPALGALRLRLDALARIELPEAANAELLRARSALERVIYEVRALVFEATAIDDGEGLAGALRGALGRLRDDTGIACQLAGSLENEPPPAVARELYRATGEAVRNVVQHAEARSLTVTLRSSEDATAVEIADDGRGVRAGLAEPRSGHLGILGMRARMTAVGGTFAMRHLPGGGTLVSLRAPHAP